MKTSEFTLYRDYDIKCKLFQPDNGDIERIILGVHGFAGDKESSVLSALAEEMQEHKTALVCFDFPAHGASEADETYFTVVNCKRDLLTVAKWANETYQNAEKTVFATSFGGYISLLCAKELSGFSFVLRAPAVTMPKVLTESVLKIPPAEFQRQKSVDCGFERKINLPYAFYEELLQYDPVNAEYSRKILIIHGDRDDIVPYTDILSFCKKHPSITLMAIAGADHRFKKDGELAQIIKLTKDFILQSN